MSPVARKEPRKPARRIKHQRDYEAASAIARKMSQESDRDTAAEKRLQSLLHELDQFEGDESDGDELADDLDAGLRRRWSDDGDAE